MNHVAKNIIGPLREIGCAGDQTSDLLYFSHVSYQLIYTGYFDRVSKLLTFFVLFRLAMDSHEDQGPLLCSQRWILAYMGFMFGLISYLYRVNMNVAVVCMVKPHFAPNGSYPLENVNFTINDTNLEYNHMDKESVRISTTDECFEETNEVEITHYGSKVRHIGSVMS